MSTLLLALALAAPAAPDGVVRDVSGFACSVAVTGLDPSGRERSAPRVFAAQVPALVFRGPVPPRAGDAPLLFDVFNPRGQRYQVLVGVPLPGRGPRSRRRPPVSEARLAVAGSSIAWTSMYGRWRVEPRIEGTSRPCGPARTFTIRP